MCCYSTYLNTSSTLFRAININFKIKSDVNLMIKNHVKEVVMESTKKISLIPLLIACSFLLITKTYSQQSSGQLFEKALYMEEVSGELQQAIDLYKQIIKESPEDREVAAKSLLHMGICYEKLGLKKAQVTYQDVINKYSDQEDEVAMAKERLNRLLSLQEVPDKPVFRKITIPTKPDNGVLSPDGTHMAFTSEGSVWIVPIQGKVQTDLAGEPQRLTEPMGATNFGNTLAWSNNGQWIAFNAVENEKEAIYVIPAKGGKPKKIQVEIWRSGGGNMHDHRLSLSPDGSLLAFSSLDIHSTEANPEKHGPFSIYITSVDGEYTKRLTEDYTEQPAFSPDGKKIAYLKRYKSKGYYNFFEGWVISVTGGTPVQVTDSSTHVESPVWSPDGMKIAFNSRKDPERSDIDQVLIVSIGKDGKPQDFSKTIKLPKNIYQIPAGWSQYNKIGYHFVNPRYQAIYTVPFTGGKATQITQEGWGNNPCWSRDGKKLLFRWEDRFATTPAEGGEMSFTPIQSDEKIYMALPGGGNHLSPDGKTIVFAGAKMNHKGVDIMTIPVEGGEPVSITKSPTQDRFPCWSPDGKYIAFIRYEVNSDGKFAINISVVSSEGGEVRQVTSERDSVDWSGIRFLPDGNHVAFFSRDHSIKMIPIQGGVSKEIVKVEGLNSHNEIIMLPDGKNMAYSSGWKIWMVSLDGREPIQIETGLDEWLHSQIAISPDGETLAFTAFTGGDFDLWLMESFLP
jgi:Tol biopolymer transport system component